MKLIAGFIVALILSMTSVAAVVSPAYAWSPFGNACSDEKTATSSVCVDQANTAGDPLTGPNGIILQVADVISFVAGAAAVIIIILAGLRMITSGGSSDDVAGARRTLIYAIVGLVVIVLARVILGFVLGLI